MAADKKDKKEIEVRDFFSVYSQDKVSLAAIDDDELTAIVHSRPFERVIDDVVAMDCRLQNQANNTQIANF